jgi:hypothetical protein
MSKQARHDSLADSDTSKAKSTNHVNDWPNEYGVCISNDSKSLHTLTNSSSSRLFKRSVSLSTSKSVEPFQPTLLELYIELGLADIKSILTRVQPFRLAISLMDSPKSIAFTLKHQQQRVKA